MQSLRSCACSFSLFQGWEAMYHYTDSQGLQGIRHSGVIRVSRDPDLGRGVFFTSMDPVNSTKEEIADAIWHDSGE